jgi:glycosyltransferase involved in cell wall biosynthesis
MENYPRELLLDVGVPFRLEGKSVFVEAQAYNGLLRWLDNFRSVTLCAPVLPQGHSEISMQWIPVDDLTSDNRLKISPFPWGYDVATHFRHARNVRKTIRTLIAEHRYLCFSNLGWLGAWGRIAAEEAYRSGRPYSIWLDWVLHEMPARVAPNPLKRVWHRVQQSMLRRNSLRDVRRCSLGLFHGRTVFDAYAPLCSNPNIVHDIHLGTADIVSIERMERRLQRHSKTLKIIYVGRVHEMKGPWHWLDVMQRVVQQTSDDGGNPSICAEWIGDGPLLSDLRAAVAARGLDGRVFFNGAEADRQKLLERLRNADLFVFCHLTPESPRCLVEALMSALPIIGFYSAYASDLLGGRNGGMLSPSHDIEALSYAVLDCIQHPQKIAEMAVAARAAGSMFSDVAVFRHRSDLIKEYL